MAKKTERFSRIAYAIPSKYLALNGEIETQYRCSKCDTSVSREHKKCSHCYRTIIWK